MPADAPSSGAQEALPLSEAEIQDWLDAQAAGRKPITNKTRAYHAALAAHRLQAELLSAESSRSCLRDMLNEALARAEEAERYGTAKEYEIAQLETALEDSHERERKLQRERDEALARAERAEAEQDHWTGIAAQAEQDADDAKAEIARLTAALAGAREMLKELADGLEAEVEDRYAHTKNAGLRRQYERDIDPVHRARAIILPSPTSEKAEG